MRRPPPAPSGGRRRRAVALRLALGAPPAALAALALLGAAERWAGATELPAWLPPAPYRVGRLLAALPSPGGAMALLGYHGERAPALAATATPWPYLAQRTGNALGPGSYLGFNAPAGSVLTLFGHPCSSADPVVSLTLRSPAGPVVLPASALVTESSDLGTGHLTPTTRTLAALPPGDYAPRALARCRSGAERVHQLGALSVVEALPNPALLGALLAAHPGGGVYAELIVINPGLTPVTLTRLDYAPAGAATGAVIGATGRPEEIPAWRAASLATDGPPEPAPVTPLRELRADSLGLLLEAGEYAFLAVNAGSYHRTRPALPALSHPVLHYVLQDGTPGAVVVPEDVGVGWTGG